MTADAHTEGHRLEPLSGRSANMLVVILHGYGADGADLIDLGRAWQGELPDAAFYAPDAPDFLPFDGLSGRQWFPLNARDQNEYRLGAEAAQPIVERLIEAELDRLHLDHGALVLAGFSQGAMMALQAGLRRPTSPVAIIAYSGTLPGPGHLDGIDTEVPVLLIHGRDDDIVPAYHLDAAKTALETAGVPVEAHLLDRLGHGVDERGMAIAGRFLRRMFKR